MEFSSRLSWDSTSWWNFHRRLSWDSTPWWNFHRRDPGAPAARSPRSSGRWSISRDRRTCGLYDYTKWSHKMDIFWRPKQTKIGTGICFVCELMVFKNFGWLSWIYKMYSEVHSVPKPPTGFWPWEHLQKTAFDMKILADCSCLQWGVNTWKNWSMKEEEFEGCSIRSFRIKYLILKYCKKLSYKNYENLHKKVPSVPLKDLTVHKEM